jgi:hypothetical protein
MEADPVGQKFKVLATTNTMFRQILEVISGRFNIPVELIALCYKNTLLSQLATAATLRHLQDSKALALGGHPSIFKAHKKGLLYFY